MKGYVLKPVIITCVLFEMKFVKLLSKMFSPSDVVYSVEELGAEHPALSEMAKIGSRDIFC